MTRCIAQSCSAFRAAPHQLIATVAPTAVLTALAHLSSSLRPLPAFLGTLHHTKLYDRLWLQLCGTKNKSVHVAGGGADAEAADVLAAGSSTAA
jgi:hypothetical protein